MTHPETHVVVASRGGHPITERDSCVYCNAKIGEYHKPDCVCRQRTVLVEATLTYTITVPKDWDEHMIEFSRNARSWCANSMISELEKILSVDPENPHCLCDIAKFKYLREATQEDERKSNIPANLLGGDDNRSLQEKILADWKDFKDKWDITPFDNITCQIPNGEIVLPRLLAPQGPRSEAKRR